MFFEMMMASFGFVKKNLKDFSFVWFNLFLFPAAPQMEKKYLTKLFVNYFQL